MGIACYIRDKGIFHHVHELLRRAGFDVERFVSETSLLRALRRHAFDMILVDTGSEPPVDQFVFSWLNCRTGESTPVVLLSEARSADKVAYALEAGADDFISKPFNPAELIARIHAVLRRCGRRSASRVIELAGFTLDRDSCRLHDRGVEVDLTQREFIMAWLLFSSPGVYISRETISTAIWGVDSEIAGRTIEQHIYKLRKKIRLGGQRGVLIQTAYCQGYRLELAASEAAA